MDCPDNQMNTAPQNSSFGVTVDDLRTYDWEAELGTASRRECHAFNDVLIAKAKVLSDAGDPKGANVFQLLAAIAFFWPNYHDIAKPFRPAIVDYQTGKRSLVPE